MKLNPPENSADCLPSLNLNIGDVIVLISFQTVPRKNTRNEAFDNQRTIGTCAAQ